MTRHIADHATPTAEGTRVARFAAFERRAASPMESRKFKALLSRRRGKGGVRTPAFLRIDRGAES